MNSIAMENTAPCSGCGGCMAVCPRNAIRMEMDARGFYRAVVRQELCVKCGLCKRVCGRFTPPEKGVDLRSGRLYALQSASAQTVRSCSSGGIAHELAVCAVEAGGFAAGAVYDLTDNRVKHGIVTAPAEIAGLDGSKYLQSDPAVFREVLLRAQDKPCTVFGTPCQITSMAAAAELHGIRDRLLLVEIFCHGVPSYRLWEDTLERAKRKLGTDRFDQVQFRYKKDDWHSYCLKITAGAKQFLGSRERELFWQVFFENVLLGDACMVCRARRTESGADIRLGDYWGAKFQHRSDGVSGVFACTEKGVAAVEQLLKSGRALALEATGADEMLAAQNMAGYDHQKLHAQTMEILETRGLRAAVGFYRKRQSKKQKLKRLLLTLSALIPAPMRAKLRKANSARALRRN